MNLRSWMQAALRQWRGLAYWPTRIDLAYSPAKLGLAHWPAILGLAHWSAILGLEDWPAITARFGLRQPIRSLQPRCIPSRSVQRGGIGCCLLLTGLAVALPARAADSAFPDLQRIIDAGVLRVAILDKDVPPMIMTAQDGSPAGAEPDLARDLAEKLDVELELLRSADTYEAVIDQVAAKQADLGVSFLSSDVSRALQVYFSRPYIRQSGRLFYSRTAFARLKRDHKIETPRDIAGRAAADALQIGVVEGSVYETILDRDFPALEMKPFPDLPTLMQAVRNDEILGGVHGGLQIAFFMRRHPSTAIHVAVDPELRRTSDICIAVRPDAPNLLRWVDVYLATHVGLDESDAIVARYLEHADQLEEIDEPEATAAEQEHVDEPETPAAD
jgi:ABC-type amino acid transport substrate-binding protein